MNETIMLFTAILGAALGGWILASWRAGRTLDGVRQEAERVRVDLGARLGEQGRILNDRDADLRASESLLDEVRLKQVAASEECVRLKAVMQAEHQAAVERLEKIARLELAVTTAETSRDTERVRAAALEVNVARLTTFVEQEQKAHVERLQAYRDAEEQFKAVVKATAADALGANNEAFLALAQTKLGDFQNQASADLEQRQKAIHEVIAPVSTLLKKLEGDVQLAEQNRVETRTAILASVQNVATLVPALQQETSQLARALRQSGTRGKWGELQLRRTLESAGLVEGEHYSWQPQVDSENGRLIPDVVIHLPGGGNVVVDAKTPMKAFLDAFATEDEAARVELLQQHVVATRQHVLQLSAKGYGAAIDRSPDFVVMYVPVESALSEALRADTELIEDASKRNVMLSGPLALIPLLRAIAFGWHQHRVAERAEEIAQVGALLCDRIATVVEHFSVVGRGLDKAVDSYNKSVASLEGRLVPSARSLKALHVKGTKELRLLKPVEQRTRLLSLPSNMAEAMHDEAGGAVLDLESEPDEHPELIGSDSVAQQV
jgi:DNA recombination protein RmuC